MSSSNGSSFWWSKKFFNSVWSSNTKFTTQPVQTPSPLTLSPSPSSSSLSRTPQRSESIQSETDGTVDIIISRVSPQSDAVDGVQYMDLLMKRLRKGLKMDTKEDNRRYWMPDSNAKECYECGDKFTTIRRRHHCRICGQIFCSKCCSEEIDGKLIGNSTRGNVRVCNYCYKIVMSYINEKGPVNADSKGTSVNSDELNHLREFLMSKAYESDADSGQNASDDPCNNSMNQFQSNNLLPQYSSFKRKSSVGFREEDYAKIKSRLEIDGHINDANHFVGSHSPVNQLSSFVGYQTPIKSFAPHNERSQRPDEGSHEPLWVKEIHEEDDDGSCEEKAPFENSLEIIEMPNSIISIDSSQSFDHSSTERSIPVSVSSYNIKLDIQKDRVSVSKPKDFENDSQNITDSKIETKTTNDDGLNHDELMIVTSTNWEHLHEGAKAKEACDSLNESYDNLYTDLLTQWLTDDGLSLSWISITKIISRKIAETVRPNCHNDMEDMDIRSYVKIKTIPNGVKNDCQIINGVVFAKNVTHRKMRQNIPHPRILLLSCPIVYQRIENKFTCLDPVLLQENEYIKSKVAKICSYRPDVILVEKSVARIAQEMLLENGITLVCNVKPVVLERIARFTGAGIVSSLDAQIGEPQLGICQRFYLHTFNHTKTLMYFDGCQPHLGCTVLLRGAAIEELKKIKSICLSMIFCDYNWRLEKSFLMDEYSVPSFGNDKQIKDEKTVNVDDESIKLREKSESNSRNSNSMIIEDNSDPLRSMAADLSLSEAISSCEFTIPDVIVNDNKNNNGIKEKMIKLLSKVQLNSSPFVVTPLPYLLTEDGENCTLRKYFNSDMIWSKRFEEEKHYNIEPMKVENSFSTRNRELSSPTEPYTGYKHPFLIRDLKSPANSNEIKCLLSDFRARGPYIKSALRKEYKSKYEEMPKNKTDSLTPRVDALSPLFHQQLPVLFSSFSYSSSNAPNYCVKPWIIEMDFYGSNDIPLGGFLERYCFRSTYSCPSQSCSTPMIEHVRRFVHNEGCILILLRQLQQVVNVKEAQTDIITWSYCQKCKTGTAYSRLSSDSWSLSFAKYLELKFYAKNYGRRAASNAVACMDHSLHHDHLQFFAYKQIVASFKYIPIVLNEISLPSYPVTVKHDDLCRQKFIDELKHIAVKGYEIYSLILEKLCSIKDETNGTKYEMIVNEFMSGETHERGNFRQKIEEIQLELTSPSPNTLNDRKVFKLGDNIIILKRMIAESVHEWNTKIQEFVVNKKKDEKLASKSGNHNALVKQLSIPNYIDEPIAAIIINPFPNEGLSIDESLTQRSLSISSAASVSSYIEQRSEVDSNLLLKACIHEQEKECKDTLEALENIKIEENVFGKDSPKNSKHNNEGNSHVTGENLTLSSYACDDDIGINVGLGDEIAAIADTETYAVYNTSDCIDSADSKICDTPKFRTQSVATVDSARNTPPQTKETPQSASKTELFPVKRIIKELLTNANNLMIEQPFPAIEHYLLPSFKIPIVVKDDDPGSIIAYALTSNDYEKQLSELSRLSSSPNVKRKVTAPNDFDKESVNESNSKSSPGTGSGTVSQHIDLQFSDSNAKFYCCVYYAELFRKFRSNVFEAPHGEENYIRALSNCIPWKARGGKSGSTFCKTLNDRFILKEMSKLELQSFLNIANYYFEYYTRTIVDSQPTLLAKIFGIYRTSFKNTATNTASKIYLLVMENLFYDRIITKKFDLKGSMRNRLVDTSTPGVEQDQIVLLDENLMKMTCDCPMYIRAHSKTILRAAIQNDSQFLSSLSVMDYSLLVGIDEEHNEFVVGIIDYIRPFTWDKKLESVVKSVGSQGKLPTIVQPDLYKIRFSEAMDQYFLCVPDKWFNIVNYKI